MILVTRLDRTEILVNSDLILSVERTPDTLITFTNGLTLMVRESLPQLLDKVVAFRRRTLEGANLSALPQPDSGE